MWPRKYFLYGALILNTSLTACGSGGDHEEDGDSDTRAPVVLEVIPVDGALNVDLHTRLAARFSKKLEPTTVNASSFTVSGVSGSVSYESETHTAIFTPDTDLPVATTLTATLGTDITDQAGHPLAQAFSWAFTTADSPVDTTAPTIVMRAPGVNAIDVARDTSIVVTFSEPMDGATIDVTSFSVTGKSGTVSYDTAQWQATFTPDSLFAYDETVTVTIAGSVTDLAGNALSQDSWSFRVAPDRDPPTIVNRFPAADVSNVDINVNVMVTFSEAMDVATINTTTFTVSGKSGMVSYDPVQRRATFISDSPFTYDSLVTVTLTSGVTDVAGNPLNEESWSFRVAPDRQAPTIINRSPEPNAVDVPLDSVVTIQFSEDINPNSINSNSVLLSPGTNPLARIDYDSATYTVTLTPGSALRDLQLYRVYVLSGLRDLAGNRIISTNWTFTTIKETVPPSVISTTPAADATNVGINSPIIFEFDDQLDPSTITSSTFTIASCTQWVIEFPSGRRVCIGWAQVATTPTYSPGGTQVSVDHEALVYSIRYQACASAAVEDDRDNPMGSSFCFWFTAEPDTGIPDVVSVSVQEGQRFVDRAANFDVCFDEAMAPSTLINQNIYIGGMTSTVTWNVSTLCATVNPNVLLPASSDLTLYITSGVKDLAGNSVIPSSTNFRTQGTAVTFSGTGSPAHRDINLMYNDSGAGIAVWNSKTGKNSTALYASVFNGSAWSADINLASYVPHDYLGRAQVATNGTDIFIAWSPGYGFGGPLVRSFDGADWSGVSIFDNQGTSGDFHLVRSGTNVLLVWEDANGNLRFRRHDGSAWDFVSGSSLGSAGDAWVVAGGGAGFAIVNLSGNTLTAYTSTDGANWETDTLYTATNGVLDKLDVAAGGTHFAVTFVNDTQQVVVEPFVLYGQRFTVGSHDVVQRFTSVADGQYFTPQIESNGAGRFCVVWKPLSGDNRNRIYAAVYSGASWAATMPLSDASINRIGPANLVSDGTYFAVSWMDYTLEFMNVRVMGSTGWQANSGFRASGEYELAGNAGTYGMLYRLASYDPGLYGRTYIGGAWAPPALVEAGQQTRRVLARHLSGYAGLWISENRIVNRIGAWDVAHILNTTAFPTSVEQVHLVRSGSNALVTWMQYDDNDYKLYASHYNGSAWGAPSLLGTGLKESAVATNGSRFVVVSRDYFTPYVQSLPVTGGNWSAATALSVTGLVSGGLQVAATGGSFVASLETGSSYPVILHDVHIFESADGLSWGAETIINGYYEHQLFADQQRYYIAAKFFVTGTYSYLDLLMKSPAGWGTPQRVVTLSNNQVRFLTAAGSNWVCVLYFNSYSWKSREFDGVSLALPIDAPGLYFGNPSIAYADNKLFMAYNASSWTYYATYDRSAWSAVTSFASPSPVSGVSIAALDANNAAFVLHEGEESSSAPRGYALAGSNRIAGDLMDSPAAGGEVLVKGDSSQGDYYAAWTRGTTNRVYELKVMTGL